MSTHPPAWLLDHGIHLVFSPKETTMNIFSQALKLLHHTFVPLTKNSPKVVFGDWKKSGDLHLSTPGSLWIAEIKVLGCSFSLQVPIKVTVKKYSQEWYERLKVKRNDPEIWSCLRLYWDKNSLLSDQ